MENYHEQYPPPSLSVHFCAAARPGILVICRHLTVSKVSFLVALTSTGFLLMMYYHLFFGAPCAGFSDYELYG